MNTVPTVPTQTSQHRLWDGVGPVLVLGLRTVKAAVPWLVPVLFLSLPLASGVWRLNLTLGSRELRVAVF